LFIGPPAFAETPVVGANAPDFTLTTPTGKSVRMSAEQRGNHLVLVVLRDSPAISAPTV
jgi:peroxiredoxin